MLEALSKFVDILKATGWQTGFLAGFGALFLYLTSSGALPPLEPWMLLLGWAIVLCFAALASASLATNIQDVAKAGWQTIRRKRARRAAEQAFRDYVPFLTDKERQIFGYLLKNKMKTFTADSDGGYAGTLMARGFVRIAAQPGQHADFDKVPFLVPEHVWKVLEDRPDEFPYRREKSSGRGDYEAEPWRIPWMVR